MVSLSNGRVLCYLGTRVGDIPKGCAACHGAYPSASDSCGVGGRATRCVEDDFLFAGRLGE